jgi:hypothetical protein
VIIADGTNSVVFTPSMTTYVPDKWEWSGEIDINIVGRNADFAPSCGTASKHDMIFEYVIPTYGGSNPPAALSIEATGDGNIKHLFSLSLWESPCASPTELKCVRSSSDFGYGSFVEIYNNITAGQTVYVILKSKTDIWPNNINLLIKSWEVLPPSGEDCSTLIDLNLLGTRNGNVISYWISQYNAPSVDNYSTEVGNFHLDTIFKYTGVPGIMHISIDTCQMSADTLIAVGSECGLEDIGYSDDACGDTTKASLYPDPAQSDPTLYIDEGETVYIALSNWYPITNWNDDLQIRVTEYTGGTAEACSQSIIWDGSISQTMIGVTPTSAWDVHSYCYTGNDYWIKYTPANPAADRFEITSSIPTYPINVWYMWFVGKSSMYG